MIPEHFKQNIQMDIQVFGFEVQVDYRYWWPEKRSDEVKFPLVCHAEFRSDVPIISPTGYHSHFFYAELLKHSEHGSLEEMLVAIGEHLARQNGYEAPERGNQLSLF
ncbi:hypothetical protein [Pedobacter paludis]|uniref:Uncharacterized protein n=1 Tax=Pedobacter paludis TaxID=2203212 RepID=A0A317F3R3_9SPHI|nr:hypothetical protein [Pedobacter paludis]PWS32677.1 hypothetical protein DF947_06290 [Pedobacter paludis]